ncbi:MAG: histidine kinase [Eubacteriales bacterium]|nr:histidine kinase [Eubacteriales bacterium]
MEVLGRIRRRIGSRLMYEYLLLLFLMAGMILISFLATDYIARNLATEEARQAVDVVFEQAGDRILILEEDIDSLYNNVVYNPAMSVFLQASEASERWDNLDGFLQVVGNNMRINENLENVSVYNEEGYLVAARGDVFFHKEAELLQNGLTSYSNRLVDSKTGSRYFQVGMPVYDDANGIVLNQIGSVVLLFNVNSLQEIVDSALPNEEAGMGIVDRRGATIVSAGRWLENYGHRKESGEEENSLVYVSEAGKTGWRLISVVPKDSLFSGVNRMQRVNLLTYICTLLMMALVCVLVYARVIRPISRQTAFMAGFARDTGQRIEVTEHNEIGELARKMNQMLDDIEALNSRVIESRKRVLELEYAKKQTEMVAYRSQINPHFLANTFNCIRGIALCHGDRDVAELTMALAVFFRYSIQGEEMVTVQEALESLRKYALIIEYRFNGKHKIELEAGRELFHRRFPRMLVQPLVENAVLHGLETKTEGGAVRVHFELLAAGSDQENRYVPEKLSVTVEDNGQGISREQLQQLRAAMETYDRDGAIPDRAYGIGVLNVYRRMRLFYGDRASFWIESEEGRGTRIRLILPLQRESAEEAER